MYATFVILETFLPLVSYQSSTKNVFQLIIYFLLRAVGAHGKLLKGTS